MVVPEDKTENDGACYCLTGVGCWIGGGRVYRYFCFLGKRTDIFDVGNELSQS